MAYFRKVRFFFAPMQMLNPGSSQGRSQFVTARIAFIRNADLRNIGSGTEYYYQYRDCSEIEGSSSSIDYPSRAFGGRSLSALNRRYLKLGR